LFGVASFAMRIYSQERYTRQNVYGLKLKHFILVALALYILRKSRYHSLDVSQKLLCTLLPP
jgi:uncharacterized membrane protein